VTPDEQRARWQKRRREIVLLVSSKNDMRHEPEGADAKRMRLAAQRGEVPSKQVPCPNGCTEGWKVDRFQRRRPCERCGGGEHLTEEVVDGLLVMVGVPFPGRGWIEIDPYTEREVGSERTGVTVARTRTVMCDRCGGSRFYGGKRCLLCRGSGRREVAAEPLRAAHTVAPRGPAGASERERDEEPVSVGGLRLFVEKGWRELGSYQAVDEALARLHEVWPFGRVLIHRVYEERDGILRLDESELSPVLRKKLEAALRILDRLLPRRLRVPRAIREAAERKEAVVR
jgi:hypothetical protein